MKKFIILAFSSLISISLFAACGKAPAQNTSSELPSSSSSAISSEISSEENQTKGAVIYIGSGDSFKEYPLEYDGEITPEILIEEMSRLTGWNLDLADKVYSGKGGMTVCFADTAAIFTGPPEKQNEEFFVYDTEQLCSEILDSIKHTLQYNFIDRELGNPDNLDVYYCVADNKPITIEALGVTIPIDEPYSSWKEITVDKNTDAKVYTADCEFEGLADSHSVEVLIDGNVEVFQFYDDDLYGALSKMEIGESFSCQYAVDNETETKTMLKIVN